MSVEVGRRVFVGSVVTGLPLLVQGRGISVGAQRHGRRYQSMRSGRGDPRVFDPVVD